VYGGQFMTVIVEMALIGCYLFLAIKSANEHPQ
jgi:large-conductance mechanosensitive channel